MITKYLKLIMALLACAAVSSLRAPFHDVVLKPVQNGAAVQKPTSAGELLKKPTVMFVVRRPG